MSPVTFRPARRHEIPLLLAVVGGTGSGKSMSAMRLAKGIAGDKPFAYIDTEAGRGLHYADMFQFDHALLQPPFTGERYTEAIFAAEQAGYPVVVVDSFSHVYAGDGGVLDQQEAELERMAGNDAKRRESMRMASWIAPKSQHKRMVSRLLQLRCHLIVCLRAEQKIEVVREGGRMVVREKQSLTGLNGWIPICEKAFPFEVTMSLLLTADAPGVPHPIKLEQQLRSFVPLDAPLSEETGAALAKWAAGSSSKPSESEAADAALEGEVTDLVSKLLAFADEGARREQVLAVIARNRRSHSDDLGAHLAWLGAQFEKAEAAAAAREDEDLDLFDPPTPQSEEA